MECSQCFHDDPGFRVRGQGFGIQVPRGILVANASLRGFAMRSFIDGV